MLALFRLYPLNHTYLIAIIHSLPILTNQLSIKQRNAKILSIFNAW